MNRINDEAPRLSAQARRAIGAELRAALRPVTESPLPTDQVELILSLRRKLRERSGPGAPR